MYSFNTLDRRFRKTFQASAALLMNVMLGLFAAPALADDDSCILGRWKGTIKEVTKDGSALIPVFMEITSLNNDTDGAKSGELRFSEPRACRLKLLYAGKDEGQYVVTMTEPNGGYCAKLVKVQLRINCVPTSLKVAYRYQTDNTNKIEEFDLVKNGAARK